MYKCRFCGKETPGFNCGCVKSNKNLWDTLARKAEREKYRRDKRELVKKKKKVKTI